MAKFRLAKIKDSYFDEYMLQVRTFFGWRTIERNICDFERGIQKLEKLKRGERMVRGILLSLVFLLTVVGVIVVINSIFFLLPGAELLLGTAVASAAKGGGHLPAVAIPMRWARTDKGRQLRKEAMKRGLDKTPFSEGCRELVESDENISGCITNALAKDSLLRDGIKIRRLTPIECERLQGFPDNWTKIIMENKKEMSDTQRYKQMGNAVTVNVIQAIGTKLISVFKENGN